MSAHSDNNIKNKGIESKEYGDSMIIHPSDEFTLVVDESSSQDPHVRPVNRKEKVARALFVLCYVLSWACILFVPIWKLIDTSYLFRERDDPSLFDKVTDYFSYGSKWPFANLIDNGKDTYRVYFFIMPFCLGFLFLAVRGMTKKPAQISIKKPRRLAWLRRRIVFGLTALDLILISAMLIYTAILLWARAKRSLSRGAKKLTFLYEDSKEPLDPLSWQAAEVMGKTLGVLTITLLGWFVLMPIGRRSVLLDVIGIPWESAIKYHRWLGWYTLVALLAHTFVYIAVWIYANGDPVYDPEGNLVRHMIVPGSCNDGSCDDDTKELHIEMMYGFAALLIMIIMSAFAINYVRRRYFEVFYYTHQLFRLVVIFLCFHYKKTMLYLMPGVVMILIDKTIGYLSIIGSVQAKARCLTKDIFELRVRKDPKVHCGAGQYVFVNVPAVSVVEWHPITVTWSIRDEMALHIRSCGPQTWTQKVYNLVTSGNGPTINVKLDGFYGEDLVEKNSLPNKDAVLLVCGGSGLTFPISIIMELCNTNGTVPVYLHWVTRTKQEYAAFQDLFAYAAKRFGNLSVSIWITLRGNSATQPGTFMQASVPKMTEEQCPRDSNMGSIRHANFWRPFPSWLWPKYTHALVTALAIFLGVSGYSLSRDHELEETNIVLDRFLDLLFAVLFAFAFLCVLIGLRFLRSLFLQAASPRMIAMLCSIARTHRKRTTATAPCSPQPSAPCSRQPSGDLSSDVFESIDLDTIELGNAPLIEGTGQRPNFEEIFQTIESDHNGNIAVLACGPRGLVDSVRKEYQKEIQKGWTMEDEDEWEW